MSIHQITRILYLSETVSILRTHRLAIGVTYSLALIERSCTLAYPALTGLAVDGLVDRNFRGLTALTSVWLLHLVVAFVRHRYDTRVFMRIYAEIAVHTTESQKKRGHSLSKISARVELARNIVDFFEAEIPAVFHNLVAVVGSLSMLLIYDLHAGLIAMLVLLPMSAVNAWYWKKALRLNEGINNQIEREVDALASARSLIIDRHFRLMWRWRVALSDAESWTWAVTEIATIVALVVVLINFTQSPGFTAGSIYAILAYVYDYLEGLDDVPNVVNNLANLKDIRERLVD
jgi:ABC-type bacteriocin/lantibiotic exporter with double-glycine peptidase domain